MKAKSRLLRWIVLAISVLVVLVCVAGFAACEESDDSDMQEEPDVPATVTGITLSSSALNLVHGETGSLTATVSMSDGGSYGGEYVWSSLDEKVATVSGNSDTVTVVAMGVGSATVSVKVGEESANCSVTVVAAVTDISLSSTSLELVIGGEETGTLEASVTMSDESEYEGSYVWSSSDESVAKVEGSGKSATVTAVEEGTTTITATAQDMTGSCKVTVTELEPDGPAGYLKYERNSDGGYTVTGVKEDYIDDIDEVLIPDVYKRAPVTAIAESAFEDLETVESVTIGENVSSIGAGAFSGCTSLAEIRYDAIKASDLSEESCVFENVGIYCDEAVVTIGACVEHIPAYLFYQSNISEIVFEDDCVCESIGKYSFAECASLNGITIPQSVESLGEGAFEYCTAAETIYFDAASVEDLTSGSHIFYGSGADGLIVAIGPGVERIPAHLFCQVNVSSVTFDDESKCESIGASAFYECASLGSVTMPRGVAEIEQYAFYGCSNLASVAFEGGACESIGQGAFAYCASLMSIVIPNGVKTIGEGCFEGCIGLESMTLPFVGGSLDATGASRSTLFGYIFGTTRYDGGYWANQHYGSGNSSFATYRIPTSLTEVVITGGQIFYGTFEECTSLTSITIPDVAAIEDMVFNDCQSLESVNMPKTVTSIGNEAFEYCISLTDVAIPNGVTSIGVSAFAYCVSLESIEIPDSVTVVGENIFEGCISLTDVTMGSGLKEISNYMFCFCIALEEITIPTSVTSIGYLAFYGCTSLKSIEIPNSVSSVGSFCFLECTALESATIEGRNLNFEGGTFLYCTALKSVTLGSGLQEIGESMFYGCTALESVVIPDGAMRIGTYAFYGCTGLKSVTIGTGVKTIMDYAFYDCTALTEINYNATTVSDLSFYNNYVFYRAGYYASGITLTVGANVTRIPAYLFYSCTLSSLYPPRITAIIFEEGSVCTTIGAWAFYPCTSLATLVLPSSVTLVDSYAFALCSSLKTIYYWGAEEEWDAMFVANSSDSYYLNRATKYWYSEEDPQDSSGKYWHYDEDGEIAVW